MTTNQTVFDGISDRGISPEVIEYWANTRAEIKLKRNTHHSHGA